MGSQAVRNKVTTQSPPVGGNVPAKTMPAPQRSRVSNGTKLFAVATADGRSAWARRYRDLLSIHISDAGGEAVVSGAEIAIIRRATRIEVEMEMADAAAAGKGTAASAEDLYLYFTGSNSMRRLFESVGLKRVARDVTPTLRDYLNDQTASDAIDGDGANE